MRGSGTSVVRFTTRAGDVVSEFNRKGEPLIIMGAYIGVESAHTNAARLRVKLADQKRGSSDGDPHSSSVMAKEQRHVLFAQWLVETYGAKFLSTGSGVLDVGGGKGGICAALGKLGIPTVLLEPCPRDSSTTDTEGGGDDGDDGDHGVSGGGAAALSPTQPQPPPTAPFEMIVAALEGDGSSLLLAPNEPTSTSDAGDPSREGRRGAAAADEAALRTDRLLRGASMVVGMHSDEATEPIVDFAFRLGIPFAVVPCCVFQDLFPLRVIQTAGASGGRRQGAVKSYNSFCRYLLAKDAAFGTPKSTVLPFVGKNTVIYSPPRPPGTNAAQQAPPRPP